MGNGEGSKGLTLTWNDAFKGIVFIITICGYGFTMQAKLDALSARVSEQTQEIAAMREEVNEWKRATTGLVFEPRKMRPPHQVDSR